MLDLIPFITLYIIPRSNSRPIGSGSTVWTVTTSIPPCRKIMCVLHGQSILSRYNSCSVLVLRWKELNRKPDKCSDTKYRAMLDRVCNHLPGISSPVVSVVLVLSVLLVVPVGTILLLLQFLLPNSSGFYSC